MSRWRRIPGLSAVCIALATSLVGASDIASLVARYVEARDQGQLGEVTGSVHAMSRAPAGPPTPYEAVEVRLLPYSPDVEQELDRIKLGQRDSQRAYVDAAARVADTRVSYERALLAAGAADLVGAEVTSAAGEFRFARVPAGQWLLFAWRGVAHATPGRKIPQREVDSFVGNQERTGHVVVTYWRARVEVLAGEVARVALTDRNTWMTGVLEERRGREPAGVGARRSRGTTR